MKKLRELKENKKFKIVSTVIRTFMIVMFAAFIVVVFLQRFSDNKISFFNYRMFTIISGSMKPKYNIGDVLISKEVEPTTIKVGDAISYQGTAGDFRGKVVTHEVVEIEKDINGKYLFHAKGLTNLVEDPVVKEDQVLGVVVYKTLILSTVYKIVGTSVGFYLFIIIPFMYIIGSEIISIMLKKEEQRRERTEKE